MRGYAHLFSYRDKVPHIAVNVGSVQIHTDHLTGFCHEESSTAELKRLCCKGELTLHCDHVQTPCKHVKYLNGICYYGMLCYVNISE